MCCTVNSHSLIDTEGGQWIVFHTRTTGHPQMAHDDTAEYGYDRNSSSRPNKEREGGREKD